MIRFQMFIPPKMRERLREASAYATIDRGKHVSDGEIVRQGLEKELKQLEKKRKGK